MSFNENPSPLDAPLPSAPSEVETYGEHLTPEQEAEIDHLTDQGFNYTEARHRVGATTVGAQAEIVPVEEESAPPRPVPAAQPAPRSANSAKRKGRPLSAREKMFADLRPDLKPFPWGTRKDD